MGGPIGLDYSAVEAVIRIQAVAHQDKVFAGVRLMEHEVLRTINK